MLGQDIIGFKRQQFVKDLYNPKFFLNNFNYVHFHDVTTLVKCMKDDYYIPRDIIRVNVRSEEEFQAMKRLILESSMTDIAKLFLYLNYGSDLDVYGEMSHKRFSIVTTPTVYKWNMEKEGYRKFRRMNGTFIEVCVYERNFRTIFDQIKEWHFQHLARLFIIRFDYISLSTLTQEELHELHFHINHFLHWVAVTREGTTQSQSDKNKIQGIEWHSTGGRFMKPIYVTPDLHLWFNEAHSRESDESLFVLKPSPTNGEDIPFKELNLIRQYIDLPIEGLISGYKGNLYLIDYYQNSVLMHTFNEVPLITELILKWFQI